MRFRLYTERDNEEQDYLITSSTDDIFEYEQSSKIGEIALDEQLNSPISDRKTKDHLRGILNLIATLPEEIKNSHYYDELRASILSKVVKMIERDFDLDLSFFGIDKSNLTAFTDEIATLYDVFVLSRYKFALNALKYLIITDKTIMENSKKMVYSNDQTFLNISNQLKDKKLASTITALPNILSEYMKQENAICGKFVDLLEYNGDPEPFNREDILGTMAIHHQDEDFLASYIVPLLIDQLTHSRLLADLKLELTKEFIDRLSIQEQSTTTEVE